VPTLINYSVVKEQGHPSGLALQLVAAALKDEHSTLLFTAWQAVFLLAFTFQPVLMASREKRYYKQF
jgi:hypothetical protein